MILTILEILVFMILASLVGLILGWVLRGSMSSEQQDIADLRSKLRECKKARRDAEAKAQAATEADAAKVSESEPAVAEAAEVETVAESNTKDAPEPEAAADDAQQVEARAQVAKLVERIGSDDANDDLTAIYGVGPKFAGVLNDLGITSFKQISQFDQDDIDTVASAIGAFRDRVKRDDWVAGAKAAYKEKYGEDA